MRTNHLRHHFGLLALRTVCTSDCLRFGHFASDNLPAPPAHHHPAPRPVLLVCIPLPSIAHAVFIVSKCITKPSAEFRQRVPPNVPPTVPRSFVAANETCPTSSDLFPSLFSNPNLPCLGHQIIGAPGRIHETCGSRVTMRCSNSQKPPEVRPGKSRCSLLFVK